MNNKFNFILEIFTAIPRSNMCDESDQELSDLEMEMRTWNKLEKNMKSLGFREGVVKGKDISLQEGFRLGYLNGFKLGKCLGVVKGIINCESKLGLTSNDMFDLNEKALKNASSQICVLCSKEKTSEKLSNDTSFSKLEDLISVQESHNNDVLKSLKKLNLGDLKSSLDKG